MASIFRSNNFLSLAGNVSAAGLSFVSFALLARIQDKPDFGNFMLFLTLCTFFDLLRTGFLQTPLIKFSSVEFESEKKEVIGTAWAFGVLITIAVGVIGLLSFFLFKNQITNAGFGSFLKYVCIFSASTLPMNFATWNLQSDLRFNKIIFIRWINLGSFITLLVLNMYVFHKGFNYIIYYFMISNCLASIICLICGWTNISSIRYWTRDKMKAISNFGKYSMSTMIGSNLLRSSDTFMIGALISPAAVAMYSVPAKLFELVEIPLRSFVATALPNLSRLINNNEHEKLKVAFERYAGIVTLMLVPLTIVSMVFAKQLVVLLGGEQYADSANILRIFAVFALLMPLDRYTGVTLDVLNQPVKNFHKIILMLVVKVGGNLLVIYYIGEVWAIAVSSIFTFSAGVLLGIYFLKKLLNFSIRSLIKRGYLEGRLVAVKSVNKFRLFKN